mmetsp:Transcript_20685/g.36753  ORF Transcript_20685/g.36753 Transcript_20685/m.36753 type:complete len:309 (-) Transcript_20685:32-958(-)
MKAFYFNDPERLPVGVLGLDVLMAVTGLLAFIHSIKHGKIGLFIGMFLVGLMVEEASINNGKVWTHCHDDATLMITKCSSFNSVLYYAPWMYTAIQSATRLDLPWWAFPSGVGLLQFLYGIPYEIQGPAFGWWRYTDQDVANGALSERVWGMPIMAAYFHPAMGWGVAAAGVFSGYFRKPSLIRWLAVLLLSAPFALFLDLPVRILVHFDVSRHACIPMLLFAVFALPVLAAKAGSRYSKPKKRDYLLFSIPLIWHAFFASAKFWDERRGPVKLDEDIMCLVYVATLSSMVLHFCIDLGSNSNHIKTA